MANRKKKSDARSAGRAPQPDPQPFNNPFRGSLRGLRNKLRGASPATAPPTRRLEARARKAAPVARSDDDEFREAASGAVPLGSPRRVPARAGAPAPVVRGNDAPDPTADEHFDLRFSDRYIRGTADGVSRQTLAKLERGEFAVRSHVDLHGMALEDARQAVDDFLFDRQRHGDRCVLVITGKGRNSRHQVGVLRERIPEWLARGPSARRVLAFVTARPCDGGEGALYVLLRKRASPKARIDIVAGGGT